MQSLKSQIRLHVGKSWSLCNRKRFMFVLFTSTCGKQHNGRGDTFFCICREWICNVVFGKDIATGPRPQNWFWLLLGNLDMDPLLKMYFHVTYPTFNASNDLARNCLSVLSSVTPLHVAFSWFPFSYWSSTVLKCGVGHTWRRTSASLIYERFHGHQEKFK